MAKTKNAPKIDPQTDKALAEMVGGAVADKVAAGLQGNLLDFLALGLSVKQAHWNLVGPHFYHLHTFLDEVYEEIADITDETAERIRQIQRFPNGNADAIAADTTVPAMPLGRIQDLDAARHVLDRTSHVVEATRDRLETFEDDEVVSADLVHSHLEKLEMRMWMLRATLSES